MFYVLLGPSFHVGMGTEHTEESIRNCHRLAYSLHARDSQLTSIIYSILSISAINDCTYWHVKQVYTL